MNFSVISENEAKSLFKRSDKKVVAIKVIADLTCSSREEVAEFLGVKLIKKNPWVIWD